MKTIKPSPQSKLKKEFSLYLKQISHRLKQLRVARNLTIRRVAEMLKLPPAKMHEIEDGTCDFQIYLLIALCELYNANIAEVVIFNGENEANDSDM